jgi:hypothetical protein
VAPVAAPEMIEDAVTGSKKGSNSTLQKRVRGLRLLVDCRTYPIMRPLPRTSLMRCLVASPFLRAFKVSKSCSDLDTGISKNIDQKMARALTWR